jgi:hypothetical protein
MGTEFPLTLNSCYNDPNEPRIQLLGTAPPAPATCEAEPGGNQPTGEVAAKDPVTFCCNQ